jgi:hypothetical protein
MAEQRAERAVFAGRERRGSEPGTAQSSLGGASGLDDEARSLASRWPRRVIESGVAEALAERWVASRASARAGGLPPYARAVLSPALATTLFEARRARRAVRGLEPASEVLEREAIGRGRAGQMGGAPGRPARIARLLLVSSDGSDRLYRKIERLRISHGVIVEVLVIAGDEQALGAAVFGPGERARVVLIDHKEAVARVVEAIDAFETAGSTGEPMPSRASS